VLLPVAAAAAIWAYGDDAHADGPLGADGDPIETSQYTIDVHQGPVLAGSRVLGLAGAYAAIAEGVAGYSYNPASVAVRVPWSVDWFDWDVDGGFTLPASVTDFDFDNNGDQSYANSAAFFINGGFGLHFGDFAIGLHVDWQAYQVDSQVADERIFVNVVRPMIVTGYSFLDGELVAGLGFSFPNVAFSQEGTGEERKIAGVQGTSLHVGALWAPAYAPIRIGASTRLSPPASWTPDSFPECNPPECVEQDGDFISAGYYLPRTISLPTEVRAGIAVQLFRPFNVPFVNPHDQTLHYERVKAEIAREQEARRQEHWERLGQARAKGLYGDAIEQLEEQHEQQEEQAEEAESERLAAAAEQDRQLRLMGYRGLDREKLLISAGMKLTTITTDGVGLESFLSQTVERSGELVTVQPELGVEGEVIPGYLVLRTGGYLEPSRFAAGSSRLHGTGGMDVRIPIEWSVFGLLDDDTTFRVSGAVDGSIRYFGWGVGAGLWH
jgi:hypothetical protein